MKKFLIWALLIPAIVFAAEENNGTFIRYYGSGTNNDDILFTAENTGDWDACNLMSVTGAVDVFPSLDGTNFATAPLSLEDFGAVDSAPVLVTAAGRIYGFVGKFKSVIVRQNGATGAAASMNCWSLGQSRDSGGNV